MWLLKSIFGIAVAVGASAGAANAGSYTYTTIDVPVSNTPYSEAIGISNNGQIVGMGVSQGFLDTEGVITYFGYVGQYPGFINNKGQIAGQSSSGMYISHNGSVSYINVPGDNNGGVVTGLNDLGQVDGWFEPIVNHVMLGGYGFIDRSGIFTIIDPRSGGYIFIDGINNSGQVVGYDSYGEFIYNNGLFTNITLPGIPTDINDTDQIIGYYGSGTQYKGFLYDNGVVTTIDFPGAAQTMLEGINDEGQIVGWYSDSTGGHDFLATPTPAPESSTWAMMLLGFAGLGFAGYRRAAKAAKGSTLTDLATRA